MLEQLLRKQYQYYFVDQFAKYFSPYMTPMQLTLFGAMVGISSTLSLYYKMQMLSVFLILFSGYCDTLDGAIARQQNKTSAIGTVADIMFDRSVEFSIICGLYLVDPFSRGLLCLLMLGSILLCVTSFLLVGIFAGNNSEKSFYYSHGIIERPEAFIFFILMVLFPQQFLIISTLFCLLVVITTLIRIRHLIRILTTYSND